MTTTTHDHHNHHHARHHCHGCLKTGLSVMVDDEHKVAYCFTRLTETTIENAGCMRAISVDGGPGTCNATNQKTCFYPKEFECTCTPNRRTIPGQMRKRCRQES